MKPNKKAFTLIELLVVVLIIGILAAVALPQYQKAVAKSQAMQGLTLLKSVAQAAETYHLANGTYPESLDDLDITVPFTGRTPWHNLYISVWSNQDWSLQLQGGNVPCLHIGRLTGPYAGTGFSYFLKDWGTLPGLYVGAGTITCTENQEGGKVTFGKNRGDFCTKVIGSSVIVQLGSGIAYYNMP